MPQQTSWSTFVLQTPPKEGHRVVLHAFCQDCGCEVKPCWRCNKRKEYLDGCCQSCWNSFACSQPDDPTDSSVAPFFLCETCDRERLLRSMYGDKGHKEPKMEVWRFDYSPTCACCPLSPDNMTRVPKLDEFPFYTSVTYPAYRNIKAKEAFQKELKLSGNYAQAMIVYSAFFHNRPSKEKSSLLQKFLK